MSEDCRKNTGKISEEILKKQVSELLFERDYNTIGKVLEEYRKGEIQKKLDVETNPEKQLELMMQQAKKRRGLRRKRVSNIQKNRN